MSEYHVDTVISMHLQWLLKKFKFKFKVCGTQLYYVDSRTRSFVFCILDLEVCEGSKRPQDGYSQPVEGLLLVLDPNSFIAIL